MHPLEKLIAGRRKKHYRKSSVARALKGTSAVRRSWEPNIEPRPYDLESCYCKRFVIK